MEGLILIITFVSGFSFMFIGFVVANTDIDETFSKVMSVVGAISGVIFICCFVAMFFMFK